MKIEKYWEEFKRKEGLPEEKDYCEAFAFGYSKEEADELLKLVLEGKKTAIANCLSTYKLSGKEIPGKGDYSIIMDSKGEPRCIIHTIRTLIIPFINMTYENVKLEGVDKDIESWKERHLRRFTEEGNKYGFDVYDSMEIIFEVFEVVDKREA